MRPGIPRLPMNLPIHLGDRRRIDQLIRLETLRARPPLPHFAHPSRIHAGIDHQMGHVNVLRSELAGQALRHRPQPEFRAGEGGVARPAAQAGGRSGEQDRAAAAREHLPCRLPPGQEAGIAGHLPYLAEHALGRLQDGEIDVGADVEDADLERCGAIGLAQELDDGLLLASVEGAAGAASPVGLDLRHQRGELLAVAAPGEDGVTAGRETARNGGTDEVAGADDGG